MAGFAKGMATTSGWALVRCDCRTRIQQDRTLMDRSRAMKMATAAGNGDDQDRIEGSIAHDPADGDDSFSFESLIFQSFAYAAEHRTSELRRGQRTASKGSQGCMTRTIMGATVISTTCSEGGCV